MDEVERLDFGSFSRVERTPQGGLRIPAQLTRTGVLCYTRSDGTVVRELRHPDEVFNEDSLCTLRSAPVTNLHPAARRVTPSNWRRLTVGHVGEDVKADGKFIAAKLMIQDADTIALIERNDDPRRELSCGYTTKLDYTPGEFNGERYDAVQRSIRYNHVALVDKGRAGSEVALRLDAQGHQVQGVETVKVIKIDGVEYEVGSDAHITKIEAMHAADLKTANARADKAEGERDAAVSERDDLKTKLDVATDPKTVDALVDARAKLFANARKVLGAEVKLDGKSEREIMVDVIRKDDDKFDAADRSDEYVQAFFDSRMQTVSRQDTGIGGARRAVVEANRRDTREDDAPEDRHDAGSARERMLEHNRTIATQPLRKSTTRAN